MRLRPATSFCALIVCGLFLIDNALTYQSNPSETNYPSENLKPQQHQDDSIPVESYSLLDLLSNKSLFNISLNNYQSYFAHQIRFIESQPNSNNITATGEPVNDSLVGSLTLSFEGLDQTAQTMRDSFQFTGTRFELADMNFKNVKSYLSQKLGPPLQLPNDSRLIWPFYQDYHLELVETTHSGIEIRHHIPVGVKNMGQL